MGSSTDENLVSFVIPTLNEEEKIKDTLESIPYEKLEKMGYQVETLVVDGNSKDNTRDIALNHGAKVIIEKKQGYGYAYIVGFKNSNGDLIVTGDADGTYPLEKVAHFIKIMEKKNLNLLLTNRLNDENRKAFPPVHFVGNKLITFLTKLLFNLRISDSQSGMWIFKKDLLNDSNLYGIGMEFSTEFKIEAIKKSNSYVEIPINYSLRSAGSSKVEWGKTGARIIFFILKKRILNFLS